MKRWFAAFVFLALTAVSAEAQMFDSKPLPYDNRDGCGSERLAVDAGRDAMRRDRYYKETDRWFQDRLKALEKCVAEAPARGAAAAKHKVEQRQSAERTAAGATTNVWLVFLVALPIAIILSYAQSAGIAGNAAWVRLGDWKGSAIFIWCALAVGTLAWYFSAQAALAKELDRSVEGRSVLIILASLLVMLAGYLGALGLAIQFVFKDLWVTTKGLVMLAHYVFVRHPAQAYLPIDPTSPLARRDFGRAIRGHGIDLKGFWTELVTPDFVRRHKLERAAQVEAQLKADTSILKAAMERESTRAAHQDQRDNA